MTALDPEHVERAWPRDRRARYAAAWNRLLAFVPTRRAAVALFALALVVFWVESLGWPMAKGRDTWDYLVYYLQLFDSDPPISELQLFRTPLTPLVLGIPLDLGGSALLEVVFGVLYGVSILAWSAMALTFALEQSLPSLAARAWHARGYGDFWSHMLVAEGAVDGAIDAIGVSVWDLAAVQVIVEEAGGTFTDFSGERRVDGGSALTSNGHLHPVLLDAVAGLRTPSP